MVEKSHVPFIDLVLHNDHLGSKDKDGNHGRKYSRSEIEAFLNGEHKDEMLSVCFEYWSYGNTGKVAKLLGSKAVTDISSTVDPALLEGKAKLEAREEKLTGVPAEHLGKVSSMNQMKDDFDKLEDSKNSEKDSKKPNK